MMVVVEDIVSARTGPGNGPIAETEHLRNYPASVETVRERNAEPRYQSSVVSISLGET